MKLGMGSDIAVMVLLLEKKEREFVAYDIDRLAVVELRNSDTSVREGAPDASDHLVVALVACLIGGWGIAWAGMQPMVAAGTA